ncbi:isochorismatase family protein [Halomonas sp. PR-M31]|uniref:isochorismatase family protein n=1 Tax=Halomonas sp. PR-M31 TaxID=1471202 RepID=UPI000651CD4F|nr:isochorismatase family protein [Halomonas sp. PR-M31]
MNEPCNAKRSTLLVVDLQERLMPVIHEAKNVVARARVLIDAARLLDIPVIGTEQNPLSLGPSVSPLRELCDDMVTKIHFDACIDTPLLETIEPGRDEVIVVGCEAHVCVLQTVLGLLRHNYQVRLVSDAIGSRNPLDKAAAIERARDADAWPVTSEMVVFEWLHHCKHPRFREVLALVK